MPSLGSLEVDLNLENANFVAGLKRSVKETETAAKSIRGAFDMAKAAFVGFAGGFAVEFMSNAIQQAFDYTDAIQDLSDRTGASTDMIQKFGYAAQLSGSSVEGARAGLEKFSKLMGEAEMGNKAAETTLAKFGITSRNVDDAVRQAADGIQKLTTPTARAAATTELFGKKQQDLTATLAGGSAGLSDLGAKAQELGIVLDKDVIANAGKANDQFDTMKMILGAEMANGIAQNADAIANFAQQMINAAVAAGKLFSALSVSGDMDILNNPILTNISSRILGNDPDKTRADAKSRLMSSHDGRAALYRQNAQDMNAIITSGDTSPAARAKWASLKRDNAGILAANSAANRASQTGGNVPRTPGTLPTATPTPKKTPHASAVHTLSDGELDERWKQAYFRSESDRLDSIADLSGKRSDRYAADRQNLSNQAAMGFLAIDNDTGTDKEIREGKKKYNAQQAEVLRQNEKEIFDNRYDASLRDEREEQRRDALAVQNSALATDAEILRGSQDAARTQAERRAIGLRIVDKQFAIERNELESVIASEKASDADKAIAREKLAHLDTIKAQTVATVNRQTMGPLESYFDRIPKTGEEINEAMEAVQVGGIEKLQEGLEGVVTGTETVAGAFKSMVSSILKGLMQIALQQLIIKPIATALFGGGVGGGGLFGGITSSLSSLISGGRANGGMTQPGLYLTGERGPELMQVGAPSNVLNAGATRALRNGAPGGGVNITFGTITSNDPAAIQRVVVQSLADAMPLITKQSADFTVQKLRRSGL